MPTSIHEVRVPGEFNTCAHALINTAHYVRENGLNKCGLQITCHVETISKKVYVTIHYLKKERR